MKLNETKVFAIMNHKGGAGKTTATDGIAYSLSLLGYKVLLIDADAQMNLSYSYGFRRMPENLHVLLTDVREEIAPDSQIYHTEYENIDIIVADTSMSTIEMDLTVRLEGRDQILARIVQKLRDLWKYDFIVFDTNPSLGLLNYNVLMAVDSLIIPVECSAYGIEGITHIKDFYTRIQKYHPDLDLLGVLLSKVEARHKVTKAVIEELSAEFGDALFTAMIEKDETVSQAQMLKLPIVNYGTGKNGVLRRTAQQFMDVTKEVLQRGGLQ